MIPSLPLHFQHPYVLFALLPAALFVIIYLSLRLHKTEDTAEQKKRKTLLRIFLSFTRIFLFILLIIAIAQPYKDLTRTEKGNPRIKILVDNSTSMQLFAKDFVPHLQEELEKHIPTELFTITEGETTPLADGIIAHAQEQDNLLLITDGQNNAGVELGDVALYARQRNVTLNAIRLQEKSYDNAVSILGPEKTIANVANDYLIKLSRTKPGSLRVILEVDNTVIKDVTTTDASIPFTQSFDAGYHTLKASIISYDYFPQNNVYHKVVKIVPKPKILLFSDRTSPYQDLFTPLYDITMTGTLPTDLSPFSAIILNDHSATRLNPLVDTLVDYTAEGNGLFVVGGVRSYDAGSYKGSRFEQLLPITIAQPGKKRGETSVVMLLDISGSTASAFGETSKLDFQKALALTILRDLGVTNKLGFAAFDVDAYTLSNMSYILEKNMPALEDQIARLQSPGRGTLIHVGLLKALTMLQGTKGSKNIILISDGLSQEPEEFISTATYLASQGVKIYTVGVGEDTNTEYMQRVAALTGGTFFQPTVLEKLKLIFGDTEQLGNRKVLPLSIFDDSHFITQGIKLSASLYGYNIVTPKTSAKLLVTTDTGDPIVVVSRFGLGRVATLATDDGSLYAPDLLNKQNSRLLTRIVNWAIGDPERKNTNYIDIQDGRVGVLTPVLIKSPQEPTLKDLSFVKTDKNLYRADILPESEGFYTLLQARYAVNYKKEYENIGFNSDFRRIITSTGGKLFEPEDIKGIVAYAKERSRRQVVERTSLAWIFILIALLIYLAEVSVRRILRNFST